VPRSPSVSDTERPRRLPVGAPAQRADYSRCDGTTTATLDHHLRASRRSSGTSRQANSTAGAPMRDGDTFGPGTQPPAACQHPPMAGRLHRSRYRIVSCKPTRPERAWASACSAEIDRWLICVWLVQSVVNRRQLTLEPWLAESPEPQRGVHILLAGGPLVTGRTRAAQAPISLRRVWPPQLLRSAGVRGQRARQMRPPWAEFDGHENGARTSKGPHRPTEPHHTSSEAL
jgi:hypothetical protein